ncbi:DUF2238 domain-containing protein [Psychrobacter sp. M13]|uniref:DUF2238 domain-containing protein n=1 Tax=Psychrobacter sp. M13 TaxID=3067275 RepID=UPI00273CD3B3|nr:DUF2238 domain-containing protein [Psychrobacter sp. M13]WLP95642.1 DUF2238 domain-containing protein [Psychrobacter sp. M13]
MSKRFNPVFISTIIVLIVMILASINPLEWSSYLLHQAGTLIFLAVIVALYRYWHISAKAYVLATLFLFIHIIGARYLYSYVPYDDWTQQLFGVRLSTVFGWQRNMYDRLVHFSYGLLIFSVMYQGLNYVLKIQSTKQLIVLTLMLNMSTSLLYELFEWGIATTLSPEAAEAYNGQQGDMWDAHQDMALALIGGITAAAMTVFFDRNNKHKQQVLPIK